MVNPIQAAFGLALIFLLPGYFLVKTIFPRERLSEDFHGPLVLFLSVSMSIVITILVGSVLGFLPKPTGAEKGYFQGAATGFPYIELSLLGVTVVFAAAAVLRGAFPRVHAGVPALRPRERPVGTRTRLEASGLGEALRQRAAAHRARREGHRELAREKDEKAARVERDAAEREYGDA